MQPISVQSNTPIAILALLANIESILPILTHTNVNGLGKYAHGEPKIDSSNQLNLSWAQHYWLY